MTDWEMGTEEFLQGTQSLCPGHLFMVFITGISANSRRLVVRCAHPPDFLSTCLSPPTIPPQLS